MTFYSRSDWGARASRGGPGPLSTGHVEGIALHWPAMKTPIGTVSGVMGALRSWQNYHMDDKGWSDIAYQVAVDQDGNRYELRGLANTSGANGDRDVNSRFGAVLLILAPGEAISDAMTAEVQRVVADHRHSFPNSDRVVGHNDIRPEATACPGPAAITAIRAHRFEPTTPKGLIMDQEVRDAFDALSTQITGLRVKEAERWQKLIKELRESGKTSDQILAAIEAKAAEESPRA